MIVDDITYDKHGRMQYHPEFHFSHGKPFSESELEYICKFYEVDHARTISFAIGRTEHTIRSKVDYLRKKVCSITIKILKSIGR
ncbi:DNA-entry nuclease [Lysinibacillus sp. Y5S-8]|uniref:DNA-entry nuclease n=1 Tax=Lysinibacillus sp. Y5S-8 TaxID=3122488 RepID=UPI0030D0D68B